MTIQELYDKCKGKEDYTIILDGDNSEGWYNAGEYIDIDDERKEIGLFMGDSI
ncbi:MAG: hypothetical protein IJ181_03985 [Acidaminococcaceae bacterium]|nr:hypothetical protein [Acidaminococcaceae bacterium]